jgi:2-polyprenyl-3-methyl-5-hydroxy-6-metoxy-1,4-benzoquinol methylase
MSLALVLTVFMAACNERQNPLSSARPDEVHPGGTTVWQLITGDDSDDDRRQWDQVYSTRVYVFGKDPSAFLKDHIGKLPQGRALDIAMGEGRNAVFIAKKGFEVDGVDLSEVALKKARMLARDNKVTINTIEADLNTYKIPSETYDVILNIDYLQRSLIPQIKKGLKHGGMVVYENYTVKQLENTGGKALQRNFLLDEGELPTLFKDFKIIVYRETNDGKDARASLIAQKP